MEKNGIIEQVREEVFPSGKAAEKPLGKYCDHTVLRAYTTRETVKQFCEEAVRYGAASVCVNPVHVAYVHELLRGTGLYTCTVIGFPLGANRSCVKAMEAALAVEDGADEVDMVINIALVKEGREAELEAEIRAVRDAVPAPRVLKVIIESAALTDEEIVMACRASENAGADFVKTSTGFHPAGGASVHAVKLMRETVGDRLGVKASGGIRDAATALAMIEAGASRLGVSATVAILEGIEE